MLSGQPGAIGLRARWGHFHLGCRRLGHWIDFPHPEEDVDAVGAPGVAHDHLGLPLVSLGAVDQQAADNNEEDEQNRPYRLHYRRYVTGFQSGLHMQSPCQLLLEPIGLSVSFANYLDFVLGKLSITSKRNLVLL